MRIIFMGTPEFAVPSLERLVEEDYRPVAVVTGPDKPRGRGQVTTPTAVKEAALRLGLSPILQPQSVKSPAFAEDVAALQPDVIVVVAFRILPPDVFNAAKFGAFNLHGSLLPRYRGAAPIHRSVMNGDRETGVTTFFLREAVDTGSIIMQRPMPIGPEETAGEVHDRMMVLGAGAVIDTVRLIERGEAQPVSQNDEEATAAPKIHRADARIRWDAPAGRVHDHVRGLSPFPGAWTTIDGRTIKIYRTRPTEGAGVPGGVIEADRDLVVACGEGAVEVLELQQEGKRRVSVADFLRGHQITRGTKFE